MNDIKKPTLYRSMTSGRPVSDYGETALSCIDNRNKNGENGTKGDIYLSAHRAVLYQIEKQIGTEIMRRQQTVRAQGFIFGHASPFVPGELLQQVL